MGRFNFRVVLPLRFPTCAASTYWTVSMTVVVWLTWPVVLVPVMVTAVGTTAEPPGGGGGGGGGVELPPPQPAMPRTTAKITQAAAAAPQRRFPRRTMKRSAAIVRRTPRAKTPGARHVPKVSGRIEGGTAPEADV